MDYTVKKDDFEVAVHSAIKKEKNSESTFGCLASMCFFVLFPIVWAYTDFLTSTAVTIVAIILIKLLFGR